MYVLWIIIWWTSICHAMYTPQYAPVCLKKKEWIIPTWWHLPSNYYIEMWNEHNRPWRHSWMKGLITTKSLPQYITLPDPLLPTNDPIAIDIYNQAMMQMVEDDATPLAERELAEERFQQDTSCWLLEVECQSSGWMISWPWWACTTARQAKFLFDWYSPQSKSLDFLTLSLLQRAYRYALLDVGHQLVPLIKHIGYYPLSKRDPPSDIPPSDTPPSDTPPLDTSPSDTPLSDTQGVEVSIPKYAIHVESLVKFYTDPRHRAAHYEVRNPHLPGHVVPPTPYLSTVSNVFNRSNKAVVNLYRDALRAYDVDQKMSDDEMRRRWEELMDDAWNWIVVDPCYYDRNNCNINDYFNRILTPTWYKEHEDVGGALRRAMEHAGLANLGTQLMLEALNSKGSRKDLQRLLSQYWDLD